jgi:hypothetical protein
MFQMTEFLPRALHLPFARLGAHEWFWLERKPAPDSEPGGVSYKAIYEMELVRRHVGDDFAMGLRKEIANGSPNDLIWFFGALSRAMAQGPKLLRPDLETCLALEAIRIDLPYSDYAQPFECLFVELPAEYVALCARRVPGARPYPCVILYHGPPGHHPGGDVLQVSCHGPYEEEVRNSIYTRPHLATIEDHLALLRGSARPDDPDYPSVVPMQRVAINLGLMLMHGGVKKVGWLDPKQHAKHERLARKDDRGRMLRAGDVELIDFARKLRLYNVVELEGPGRPAAAGTHASPHPHWRSGHWRNQAHGPARALRKRLLIPATFVCQRRFAGDLAATAMDFDVTSAPPADETSNGGH